METEVMQTIATYVGYAVSAYIGIIVLAICLNLLAVFFHNAAVILSRLIERTSLGTIRISVIETGFQPPQPQPTANPANNSQRQQQQQQQKQKPHKQPQQPQQQQQQQHEDDQPALQRMFNNWIDNAEARLKGEIAKTMNAEKRANGQPQPQQQQHDGQAQFQRGLSTLENRVKGIEQQLNKAVQSDGNIKQGTLNKIFDKLNALHTRQEELIAQVDGLDSFTDELDQRLLSLKDSLKNVDNVLNSYMQSNLC